jgi:hypothetical protein
MPIEQIEQSMPDGEVLGIVRMGRGWLIKLD